MSPPGWTAGWIAVSLEVAAMSGAASVSAAAINANLLKPIKSLSARPWHGVFGVGNQPFANGLQ